MLADFFKDTFDWAVNNPEYGIPAAIIGAPVALAATPMIVSYALFPFASCHLRQHLHPAQTPVRP
jgi:hypothetical protein